MFEKRKDGKYDRLRIERDGSAEEIPCPKIGGIPHDMIHVAVDTVMGRAGFARRVAGGEKLDMRMAASVESDQMERLVEVMQADRISGSPPPADLIDMYRVTCEARRVKAYPVTPADIAAIRAEIDRLSKAWDETAPGGALTLELDEPQHAH
ncbi:MAG TPA: hypothetical protein VNU97_11540 [Rhizomicrobium sp.]|nr:hypothetical protein [Rhizomicrobium sp.]